MAMRKIDMQINLSFILNKDRIHLVLKENFLQLKLSSQFANKISMMIFQGRILLYTT